MNNTQIITQNTSSNLSMAQKLILGFQHTLAMFGATILVPILTGLDPAVALFTAGLGTLIFHFFTKKKVPVFLGSSFAFIPAIQMVSKTYGKEYALGGIIGAGLVYLLMALIIYFMGAEKIKKMFPPIIIGPVIAIIGLGLSPTAIQMASQNWIISLSVVVTIFVVSLYTKGFFKLIPILIGVVVGYNVSIFMGAVDFTTISQASLIAIPHFTMAKFNLSAVLAIAPIAIVTIMEHIGDITINGSIVGKDFVEEPGLHRTLLGDGVAVMVAGLIGGPASTTYAENTGVLATTKVYDPSLLRIAAKFAIGMSFIGFFGAALQTIPTPVLGGASMILFGMIATIGFKTLTINNVDLGNTRNMLIMSVILVLGLGGFTLKIFGLEFSGLFMAAITGVILNLVIPNNDK